ncbi:malate dehydrogenase [Desulfoluna limicola]|uniref:Malate dehydrogenase n=1 Tax=Desulfoluna limicola TaxID=2810562 RepID=A0ABM7PHR9_9BACT|nr:malate dehydrogenase [Desulfoluna limicola]BCS97117.1 malate dehydrogenase [Desulfoluna limicola]
MPVRKIFIAGAGNVGSASAAFMAMKQLGNIYLYDILEDFSIGQAMDINQSLPYWNSDSRVTGCHSLDEMEGADVVVITAGGKRAEGMTRLDLLYQNLDIMYDIGEKVMERAPGAFVHVTSNPVDVLTWALKERWPDMNITGLGCALDAMRFRFFLAEHLNVSREAVNCTVIGTHDDNMVPLVGRADVGGIPVKQHLTQVDEDRLVTLVKHGGGDIVKRLKTRSGFFAAATKVTQIVESHLYNKQHIFPVSVMVNGEYGYHDMALSLPTAIGERGVHEIFEFDLNDQERAMLDVCADSMKKVIAEIRARK